MAIENGHKNVIKVILTSNHWEQPLKHIRFGPFGEMYSPLRSLIEEYPDLARIVLNRSITLSTETTNQPDRKVHLNFEFIEDIYLARAWEKEEKEIRKVSQPQFGNETFVADIDSDDQENDQESNSTNNDSGSFYNKIKQNFVDDVSYVIKLFVKQQNATKYTYKYPQVTRQKPDKTSDKNQSQNTDLDLLTSTDNSKNSHESYKSTCTMITPDYESIIDNHILTYMVRSKNTNLLKHPLVLSLLYEKWIGYGRLIWVKELWEYAMTLLFLNVYAVFLQPFQQMLDEEILFQNADNFNDIIDLDPKERKDLKFYCDSAKKLNRTLANDYISNSGNMRNVKGRIESICDSKSYQNFRQFVKVGLCILVFVRILNEFFQFMARGFKKYLTDPLNYLEITLYVLVTLYLLEFELVVEDNNKHHWSYLPYFWTDKIYIKAPWQHSCGSSAVLLSWFVYLLFIRQMPKFGMYILMFAHILKTFMEFLFILLIFLFGFALTFMMLLGNQVPFHSVPKSLVSTLVMMIGEMDYGDKFFGDVTYNETAQGPGDVDFEENVFYNRTIVLIIYTIFLVVCSIILMNLLTGLAVNDIDAIRRTSEFKKLSMIIADALEIDIAPAQISVHITSIPVYIMSYFFRCTDPDCTSRLCPKWNGKFSHKVTMNYKNLEADWRRKKTVTGKFDEIMGRDPDLDVDPKDYITAALDPLWQSNEDEGEAIRYELELIKLKVEELGKEVAEEVEMQIINKLNDQFSNEVKDPTLQFLG